MTRELKYALFLIFAALLVLMLRVPLENSFNEFFNNHLISELIAGSVIRVFLILGLVYFMVKKGLLQFNGLYPSFSVSNSSFLFISIAVILVFAYSSYEVYLQTKPDKLLLFGIDNALVGLFEELLFRGIVFPLLILHYAGKQHAVLKAAVLSAVLFGLVHLVGLIRNPENIFNVINVVIYAIGIGFFFACIFLITRNILVPAFIHFLVDFTNGAFKLKEEVVAATAPTLSTIILTLIVISLLALFFIGVGMYLFKRVQKEEWLQKASLIRI